MRRKRKTDDVAPLEAAAEKLVATIFREQARRLKPPADLTRGSASLRALDARWATVTRATAGPATAALSEALGAAYGVGAARSVSELGAASEAFIRFKAPPGSADEIPLDDLGHAILDGTVFKVKNPRAVRFLDRHAAKLVAGIDEATRDTLRVVVRDGVANGRSSQRIAKDITARFADMAEGRPQAHIASRAHGIAVTEMSFGYEAGQRAVADDIGAAGVDMEKSWLTVGDGRVDDLCAGDAAEGWIPLDDAFSSGDAEPPAHPYCRCTALYRVARTQSRPGRRSAATMPGRDPAADGVRPFMPGRSTTPDGKLRPLTDADMRRVGAPSMDLSALDGSITGRAYRQQVMATMGELTRDLPGVARSTSVSTGPLPVPTYGETLMRFRLRDSLMTLNEEHFTQRGLTGKIRAMARRTRGGRRYSVVDDIKGVVDHEFGHVLNARHRQKVTSFLRTVLPRRLAADGLVDPYARVNSTYGMSDRYEHFAELFAEARSTKPSQLLSPAGRITREWLAENADTLR